MRTGTDEYGVTAVCPCFYFGMLRPVRTAEASVDHVWEGIRENNIEIHSRQPAHYGMADFLLSTMTTFEEDLQLCLT